MAINPLDPFSTDKYYEPTKKKLTTSKEGATQYRPRFDDLDDPDEWVDLVADQLRSGKVVEVQVAKDEYGDFAEDELEAMLDDLVDEGKLNPQHRDNVRFV